MVPFLKFVLRYSCFWLLGAKTFFECVEESNERVGCREPFLWVSRLLHSFWASRRRHRPALRTRRRITCRSGLGQGPPRRFTTRLRQIECRGSKTVLGLLMPPPPTIYWILAPSRYINATPTRTRRFGTVGDGENRSMSGVVGMENARHQRLSS